MRLASKSLLVFVILGSLVTDAFGACPWLCLCFLQYTPITVNCSGLSLSNFPSNIDNRVQLLDLNENELETIPNLDKYPALVSLELAQNKIYRISNNAFRKQAKLEFLDLSNNAFTDWKEINAKSLFQSTLRLKTLILGYNSFKTFSGKDESGNFTSYSLENLSLRSCGITHVDGQAVSGFRKLRHLDLSLNPIKWLNDLSSPTLAYLDLSYCDIDSMSPNALNKLPNLTALRLTGNSQFSVNHGNLTSPSLQILEVAQCSLTSPGLYGFPNLTYANLRGNKIVTVKERTFIKNKLLVELDLSANEIKEIHPQAFIGSRQIAFINLSMNSLTGALPWNAFSTNYNLKTLDLSVNRLESVGNLSILALENLDLSQCLIKEIRKDSLTGLPWLMHLNLSRNPLEKIPDDIQSWYLRDIDLSYCRLSTITNGTFRRFPEIGIINLTGNRFTNPFKTYMFDYNDRLEKLRLGDNPWICDCDSQDFRAWWDYLTAYPPILTLSDQRNTKCMSPDSVSDKSWANACYQIWYPITESESSFGMAHYGTALIIIFITLGGIFAVVGAIKHGIRKRMKAENQVMEEELGHMFETNARELYQQRETHGRVVYNERDGYDVRAEESPELRQARAAPRERTESQLTQPPTYEEAVQMISASREDIVSREETGERSGGGNERDDDSRNSDSESEHADGYSIGSDMSEDERVTPKPGTTNK